MVFTRQSLHHNTERKVAHASRDSADCLDASLCG